MPHPVLTQVLHPKPTPTRSLLRPPSLLILCWKSSRGSPHAEGPKAALELAVLQDPATCSCSDLSIHAPLPLRSSRTGVLTAFKLARHCLVSGPLNVLLLPLEYNPYGLFFPSLQVFTQCHFLRAADPGHPMMASAPPISSLP